MAQRPDRPTSSGRRRTPAPPVKKPFPWGTVAISSVLGVLLAGILFYAATNQGSGFIDPLKAADKSIDGLTVSDKEARDHTDAPVKYDKEPPTGGKHNNTPQTCQVYTEGVPSERAVHSLEHGAVWITYRPGLDAGEVKTLTELAQGNPYRMLSPYPGLKSPISLQAWGRQVFVDKASDGKVNDFLEAYTSGPQAPERGASCEGSTETGPLRAAPVPPPVQASLPASPAATPSKK